MSESWSIVWDIYIMVNLSKIIERAMIFRKNKGHDVFDDFAGVRKIVDAGAINKPIMVK